ncbi:MAG: 30S ribosomal protein S13 [Thermoplasmata archaeon]|nr:30S ribosomal protein S13 [Thermoplasmata archaeon]
MADKKPTKKQEDDKGEDFKYIVRIANTDINGEKRAITALAGINGIGDRIAQIALREINFPQNKMIGHITDEESVKLVEILGELSNNLPEWMLNRQKDWESGDDLHILSTELELTQRDDINRMRMIRCYKGVRHEGGHKVRGQRTRSNGRKGLTLGVSKKKPGTT